jgi:hypothetical protein
MCAIQNVQAPVILVMSSRVIPYIYKDIHVFQDMHSIIPTKRTNSPVFFHFSVHVCFNMNVIYVEE